MIVFPCRFPRRTRCASGLFCLCPAPLATALIATALIAAAVLASCTAPVVDLAEEEPANPAIHPGFSLGVEQLHDLVVDLPESVAKTIRQRPHDFLDQLLPVLELPAELTVLVDKRNPLPEDYRPDDLVSLAEYSDHIRYAAADRTVRRIIVEDLLAMAGEAREQQINLLVQSAFRSHNYQATLFASYTARHGEEAANRFSARPGQSQHQLGTAVDFAPIGHQFTGTRDDLWLRENAWRFGFSMSYPQGYESVTGYIFEPWHYRYLGRAATRLEREFFGGIQQHMLEFLQTSGDRLRELRVER